MHIHYFGQKHFSTSFHRAKAIQRLGHEVEIFNVKEAFGNQLTNPLLSKIHYHTGYKFLQNSAKKWLSKIINHHKKPDMIWVDSGEFFGKECLQLLCTLSAPVVLYNLDDPTGKRDGNRFNSLLRALPFYDLIVVVREESKKECEKLGAKKVMKVLRSYDEIAHQPFSDPGQIPEQFISEVAFIGTWMRHEKRDEFLIELIKKQVSVSIWGDRWVKSPYWKFLKPFYKGKALAGRDYVAAIQGAKLCLGLLSKGNRDLHTTRSLEIPFSGGVLCAERTAEHVNMYEEGKEAIFWADAAECAEKCKQLLVNDSLLKSIRISGMNRVRCLQAGNENVCNKIISALFV